MEASEYIKELFEFTAKMEIRNRAGVLLDLNAGTRKIVDFIADKSARGGKVMFVGNGGSAAIASHGGIDFWKNGGIKSMCFNDGPSLTCIGNDYGYEYVFDKPIRLFAEKDDILVAISSSGKSPNILKAVEAARDKNSHVITLSGFKPDNPLRVTGDFNIYTHSSSYGMVELSHQIMLHMILDIFMARDQEKV